MVAKTRAIVDKLATIAGMELMVAAQAVDLRKVAKLGVGTQRAYQWVRGLSKFVDEDRSLSAEVEAVGAGVLRRRALGAYSNRHPGLRAGDPGSMPPHRALTVTWVPGLAALAGMTVEERRGASVRYANRSF